MNGDPKLTTDQKSFARQIRANPRFRDNGFWDMPRHKKFQVFSFASGIFLVFISGLVLAENYKLGYVSIAFGVLALHFLALPYVLAFVGYWFPSLAYLATKLDHWLEKDFKE